MGDGLSTCGGEPFLFKGGSLPREGDWIGHAVAHFFDECFDFLLIVFPDAHAEDAEAFVVVFFVKVIHVGDHPDAGPAPCGPALEDVNFPRLKRFWSFPLNPRGFHGGGQIDFRTGDESGRGGCLVMLRPDGGRS